MNQSTIYDISPVIGPKTAVFPGDQKFNRSISLSFNKGNNLTLSSINSTLHIGAHTDAPIHYHPDGDSIDKRSLDIYIGDTQVIELNLCKKERITPEHIKSTKLLATRVIFKTNSFPNPNQWNDDFNSLSPELIKYLHQKNVILVGIDTPSVDPANDQELLAHNEIYQSNMAILEGITLDNVPAGVYKLIALPLKIEGADASPVRAILIKGNI